MPDNLEKRFISWSFYLAVLAGLIGTFVLVGWQFNVDFLKHPLPGSKEMNPAAAVIFITSAFSYLLLTGVPGTSQRTFALRFKIYSGFILAIMVLLTGSLKLFSIFFGFNFPIDEILFSNKIQEDRIVPIAAFSFMLIGAALLTMNSITKGQRIFNSLVTFLVSCIALFSILGYIYQVKIFSGLFVYLPMAIHAAICFLLLSLCIFFGRPGQGIMRAITGPYAGSITARRLLPVAILVPILFGFLRMLGFWTGSFTTEFGVAILVLSIILFLIAIILYNAVLLNRRDVRNKQIEIELRASEQQVQMIFNAAPDAVIVVDEEGRIIKWNLKAETLFGWKENEILGKPLSETIIPNRFRPVHKKGFNHFLKTGEGPIIGKIVETCALKKDGNELEVALSIAASPRINDKYLFIGFVRDITERKKAEEKLKESEEKFQKSFQASGAGITITRLADSIFLDVNTAFEKMTGYSKAELIGHSSIELGMISDIKKREEVLKQINELGSAKNFEMTIRDKNGKTIEILSSAETIVLNGEKYIINIAYDITERKKAEEQLEAANKELEAFSYSVSHDLRAPLRIIDGYAEILTDEYAGKLDAEGKRVINIIKDNARRMGHLIDDLLNLSRLGRKELIFHQVDMNRIVESVISENEFFNEKKQHIQIDKLEAATCDSSLIKQVWINLISNAVKYTSGKNKPLIEISSERTESEIIYSVKDNGVGFDIKYADKLFGVFQRLHKMTEFEGTGVGLALVYRIVIRHGGKVWAEAEVNKGARFYFSLPLIVV